MSITCTVRVGGVRIADGTPGDDDAAPTALTGLSIVWGRSTTIDQPEPATCTFDVMDPPGSTSFLNLLFVGAAITVNAGGTVQSPPVLPINADPSFEAAALGIPPPLWELPPTRTAIVFRGNAAQVHTGAQAVGVLAVVDATGPTAIVARPALGSSPAAWDDLPRARLGEHWAADLYWSGPLGARVAAAVLSFTAPAAAPVVVALVTSAPSSGWGWTFLEAPATIPASAAGTWIGQSLTVTWPAWTAGTGTWTDYPDTWTDAAVVYVDDQQILAPDTAGVVDRDVLVFAGRITDVTAGWDDSTGCVVCNVIAADFTADLANRYVDGVTWPAQTVTSRFGRILTAADAAVAYRIDPALAMQTMSWLDVTDPAAALALLQDVATSVDGVLWAAMHAGSSPVLYLADPAQQSALYLLTMVGGVAVIVPTTAADGVIDLDSCDVLRDPVTFTQTVGDVVTRVAVTWLEQTVDDDGLPDPTERTVELVDADAELAYGVRRVAVSTLLTTLAAARIVADRILARLAGQSWRLSRLVYDTAAVDLDPRQTAAALDLLDGIRRLAAPILLTNLPYWSPAAPGSTLPLFLQGGIYSYVDGAWTLDLNTASAQSQGTSMPWTEPTPDYLWTSFPTSIRWPDLIGVTT